MQTGSKALLGLTAAAAMAVASATTSQAAVIAYYNFDDAANLGADASGNGKTLTGGGGGPAAIAGRVGSGAVAFDGVDDVFTRAAADIYASVPSISISFFVRSSDTTNANNGKNIARAGAGTGGLNILISGAPTATYRASPSTGTGVNSGVVESSTWRSVVATFSGGTTTVYVDGVQAGAAQTGGTYTGVTSGQFGLGARGGSTAGTGAAGTFFLGDIDEFAVYDQALTTAQAASLSNGSATPLTVLAPEPATIGVVGLGTILAAVRRRRR